MQKKTITPDYLSHEKKYNHGEEDLIVIQNHHTPIVTRELFERTQAVLSERKTKNIREKHSTVYPLSGKLRCGICGKALTARVQKRKNGSYHLWRCMGKHNSVSIRNEVVLEMLALCAAYYQNELNKAKTAVLQRISATWMGASHEDAAKKLLELYLLGEISKSDYLSEKSKFCNQEDRLSEIGRILDIAISDEFFFREILERIILYEDRAEIRLKDTSETFFFEILRNVREYRVALSDMQRRSRK